MLAQDADLSEKLRNAFAAYPEWLLDCGDERGFAVQRDEIEVSANGEKIILICPTGRGWQNFVVRNWEMSGEQIILQTARKLNTAAATLRFTPRISIENLRGETNAARLAKAGELAEIARRTFSNQAKIERVSLNQSNRRGAAGTTARILLNLPNGKTVAVCGSVIEKTDAANLLSNSIFWVSRLEERRKISEIWLVSEAKAIDNLRRLHTLLRDGWREKIKILRRRNEEESPSKFLESVELLSLPELWREKPKKLIRPKSTELSETAQNIVHLAPDEIDAVFSKRGETLRFNGLPFARVREFLGETRIWFGVEGKTNRVLDETTFADFDDLLANLRSSRQAETNDKRNALYRAAPESWLESILRRDVSRLDPNLILAPLYAQFRASAKQGSLDLLALRSDGRLVVIELKTTTDRELVFQAVDYWRQIELQRRAGNLQRAKLFGDLEILDAPPLVFLVAPLMSFHRDFDILAQAVSPEIEIWRFDLNEDWRSGVRVARRTRCA